VVSAPGPRRRIREAAGDRIFLLVVQACCVFAVIITLYPFVYVLSMSISDPIAVISQSVWLWPKGFSLGSYRMVFENPEVFRAYLNTIWYVVVGTGINVVMTILAAYPLSRPHFVLRGPFMLFIAFTMFFSGGLIPLFILIRQLGLYNTRWAVILPVAVQAWYIIIARTFFTSNIPESLHESARLDGAGEGAILLRIILPLSTPIVAVLALFYAVGHWNSYFYAMIFLPNKNLQPLQLYLVRVLTQFSEELVGQLGPGIERTSYAQQLKFAVIIVAILPIICVYPFLQKYFVQGVMIGAIKG
jgi:putative aldouronate transport system permease protein